MPGPVSTLRACAALVALQAIGLAAAAVFTVVELFVASSDDVARAAVTAVLALAAAVGLGLVARGLLAGRRWARAPALVTNLILLPVAVRAAAGGRLVRRHPAAAVGGRRPGAAVHPVDQCGPRGGLTARV